MESRMAGLDEFIPNNNRKRKMSKIEIGRIKSRIVRECDEPLYQGDGSNSIERLIHAALSNNDRLEKIKITFNKEQWNNRKKQYEEEIK